MDQQTIHFITTLPSLSTSDKDIPNKTVASQQKMSISPRSAGKSVTFTTVEVREYGRCLGDNPSVSRGAPLSIDWSYKPATMRNLDEIVTQESSKRRKLRPLSSLERWEILRTSTSCSPRDILLVTSEIRMIQYQRRISCILTAANVEYAIRNQPVEKSNECDMVPPQLNEDRWESSYRKPKRPIQ